MSNYVISCTVSGLKDLHTKLLQQAGCCVSKDVVKLNFLREKGESSDELRNRGERLIGRELSRLNALTGDPFTAAAVKVEPPPGSVTINVAAAWAHAPQMPPNHTGWSEKGLEFRLSAWDIASHTEDTVLRFVMLDSICESAGVSRNWTNKDDWPPRFAEVRLIRNLLVHGSETPKQEVCQYLEACTKSIPESRFTVRYKHLELARLRSPHLLLSVWRIVIDGCVETEVDLHSEQPADLGGIFTIDNGPFPAENLGAVQSKG